MIDIHNSEPNLYFLSYDYKEKSYFVDGTWDQNGISSVIPFHELCSA